MHFISIIALLPLVSAHWNKKACLDDASAAELTTRYFAAWTSSNIDAVPALVTAAVTEDFTYTDETMNFIVGPCVAPPEGPIAASRAEFIGLIQLTIEDATVTGEKFESIDIVIECDKLAVRWQGTAQAIGNALPNNHIRKTDQNKQNGTALPGDPVRWKGTEFMHIDLTDPSHPLVKSVSSSSDWFWFAFYSGAKVVFQKYNFPACLCQDGSPTIDKNGQCVAPPSGGSKLKF